MFPETALSHLRVKRSASSSHTCAVSSLAHVHAVYVYGFKRQTASSVGLPASGQNYVSRSCLILRPLVCATKRWGALPAPRGFRCPVACRERLPLSSVTPAGTSENATA